MSGGRTRWRRFQCVCVCNVLCMGKGMRCVCYFKCDGMYSRCLLMAAILGGYFCNMFVYWVTARQRDLPWARNLHKYRWQSMREWKEREGPLITHTLTTTQKQMRSHLQTKYEVEKKNPSASSLPLCHDPDIDPPCSLRHPHYPRTCELFAWVVPLVERTVQ